MDLELWGGPECTINRVGDDYHDQFARTGHLDRPDDITLFQQLGLNALRYPLLWERISPEMPSRFDWAFSDDRMARLREGGLRPIVGLVHHGSGPRYTSLIDPDFGPKLAAYARAVAERYPWVTDWTPVNEPCTTARFSALYGHWYPHCRDEPSFWLALISQIDGVRLAMAAVRQVNPAARLIQTDDLGRTYATAAMKDQAGFDNVRRWMTWDLLCGRVDRDHPFWARLVDMGFEARLNAILDAPCPPDIIGVNHYLTSDRFLDHRVGRYPAHLRGGTPRRRFADTEAVRVLSPAPPGLAGALRETWARYGLPIAVTEAHNGCTREEQMRWTAGAWTTARALRAEGVDVRAVTGWALLGSQGWDRLLTGGGRYEAGAFDISGGAPRPTAIAGLLARLARDEDPSHPALVGQGWWQRPIRLTHAAAARPAPILAHARVESWRARRDAPPLLIVGASGRLGQALTRACRHRDIAVVPARREMLDTADETGIAAALDRHRPWAVIDASGWSSVDAAEADPAGCFAVNRDGAYRLAAACATRDIPTVTFSSDMVFDGRVDRAYVERDTVAPVNVYGRSKAEVEAAIARLPGARMVVRTAACYSPLEPDNLAMHVVRALTRGMRFAAADDVFMTPTYVPHLCEATLDLLIDGVVGVWHLTHGRPTSWADFAREVARACGLDATLVDGRPLATFGFSAPRPQRAALASERGRLMPDHDDALRCFAEEYARAGRVVA